VHTCISRATQLCVCLFTRIYRARAAKYVRCPFYSGIDQRWCKACEASFALLIHTRTRRPVVTLSTIMREEVLGVEWRCFALGWFALWFAL
jgi:hypothetical protein